LEKKEAGEKENLWGKRGKNRVKNRKEDKEKRKGCGKEKEFHRRPHEEGRGETGLGGTSLPFIKKRKENKHIPIRKKKKSVHTLDVRGNGWGRKITVLAGGPKKFTTT